MTDLLNEMLDYWGQFERTVVREREDRYAVVYHPPSNEEYTVGPSSRFKKFVKIMSKNK